MKISLPLVFPRVPGLCASALLAVTAAVGADEEREKLLTEAVAAQKALVFANFKEGSFAGCFISKDGYAIFSIGSLAQHEAPSDYSLSDKTRLNTPTLRQLVPESGIAILKFNHQPKDWLKPSPNAIPIGLQVAIVDPAGGALAVGPVRAKTQAINANVRRATYQPQFLIGAGLRAGGLRPNRGSLIIDSAGRLRGTFGGTMNFGVVRQLVAQSTDGWFAEIAKARQARKAIPLPLPDELNPIDLATFDPMYRQAMNGAHQGNFDQAIRSVKGALKEHPDSFLLRRLHFDVTNMTGRIENLLALAEATNPGAGGTVAERVSYLERRATACARTDDYEGAGKALHQALEIAPKEDMSLKHKYGLWLQKDEKPNEALRYFRESVKINPDYIPALGALSMQLAQLGMSEEANRIRDRIFEVEDLYKSVPSSSLRPKRK